MNFANHSSGFQPCSSVGSLSMVSLSQIRDQQNLDYLQNLCVFIDQMNLNPIWYRQETPANRLKVLEIYQTAINYSKNLSQAYHQQIQALERKNNQMRQNNEEKEAKIRLHKEKVQKLKQRYKIKKHKLYKNIYTNLKRKIEQEEHQRHPNRGKDYSRSSIDRPQVVYYPMPPPNQFYPHLRHPDHGAQYNYPPPPQDHRFPHPYNEQHANPLAEPQAALAQGLLNFINGAKPNPQGRVQENVPNKQGGDKTNKQSGKKQGDKDDSDYEEGQSDIIANHLSSNDHPKSNMRSIAKGPEDKRRPSIENSGHMDLPNLGQYSKKSSTPSQKNVEEPQSNSQKEQQYFDSIANISIKNQSNMQKRGPFQSKILTKEQTPKPFQEIMPISEQTDQLGFTLPGESKTLRRSQKKPTDVSSSKAPSIQGGLSIPKQQHDVGVTNLKTSNFSRNRAEVVVEKLFDNAPPKRASRQGKYQQNQKAQQMNLQKSKEDNFDDFQLIAQSTAGDRLKAGQDFGAIQNSTIRKGDKQKPRANLQPTVSAIEQQQTSKSSNSSPKRQTNEEKVQKKRSDDYGDIYSSNIGSKSSAQSKSRQVQKVLSGPPVRSSKQGSVIDSAKEIPKPPTNEPKEDKQKQEQPDKNPYQEDFEQEFDMEDLQQSKRPSSKKQSSGPQPQPQPKPQQQETKNRLTEKKPTIRMEPSRVNIDVSSMQSITEKSKYFRLKNDQFKLKLKDNIFGKTEKSHSLGSDMEDTFDFLDMIPANSVIAKRPLLKSQIAPKVQNKNKDASVSIKSLPSGQELRDSSGGNISIHLITHDNKNQTILSRNDYEKIKDTIQQIDQNEESSLINKKKNNELSLPWMKDVLVSKPPRNDLTESSLPVSQGVLVSRVQNEQGKSSLIDLNNYSNKQRKSSESSLPADKPRKGSEEINIEIEEDQHFKDQQSASSAFRNKIMAMIRQFGQNSLPKAQPSPFPEARLKETLNALCKFDQNGNYNVETIRIKQLALEAETKAVRIQTENRKKNIDDFFNQLQTPPKLSDPKDNDSLLYSVSHFDYFRKVDDSSKRQQKKISADDTKDTNINPYTPGFESDKNKTRQSPKAANKFLLQNAKSVGGKEKDQLFKNAGEGILKFDKDDPLNREVVGLLNKKNNTEEDEYEDDDQWAE